MATNVEIKARARDFGRQRALAAELAGSEPELLEQTDVFFPAPTGRLKLRQFAPDRGELIFYQRPDTAGANQSHYTISRTGEPGVRRVYAIHSPSGDHAGSASSARAFVSRRAPLPSTPMT